MTTLIKPRMFVSTLTVGAGLSASITPQLDDVKLQRVRIVIPDGHAGLTALQIQQGGVPVFPYGPDPFIRGNDEIIDFEWDAEITANGLLVLGSNSDIYPHSWFLRWTLTDLGNSSPITVESPQAGTVPAAGTVQAVTALTGTADSGDGLTPDDLAAIDQAAGQLQGS